MILVFSLSLFLILIILFFSTDIFKGGEDEKEKDLKKEDLPVPPPPPLPPIQNNQNNSIANNDKPLDPLSGEGANAIQSYMKQLIRDNEAMADLRRENGIGLNLMSGVPFSDVALIVTNNLQSQLNGVDLSVVPLIPSVVDDGDFINKLRALKNYTKNPRPKIDSLGRSEVAKNILRLSNFSDEAGFKLLPSGLDYDGDLRALGMGECKQIRSKKKNECKDDHHEDFGKSIYVIASNMESETKKFQDVIYDFAIQRLISTGWKFIGYNY